MISFASVDRVEEKFVVCEVELICIAQSKTTAPKDKPTTMMDVPEYEFFGCVSEGDIYVVEHDGEMVLNVLCKDEHERQRRISMLRAIIG